MTSKTSITYGGALYDLAKDEGLSAQILADLGAFAEIAPGRCASTAEWTARPHGRIHFAGEHTGFDHPGVEAALASGVRAVVEISDSITRPGT